MDIVLDILTKVVVQLMVLLVAFISKKLLPMVKFPRTEVEIEKKWFPSYSTAGQQ